MEQNQLEIILIADTEELQKLKRYRLVNKIKYISDGRVAHSFVRAIKNFTEAKFGFSQKLILLDLSFPGIGGPAIIKNLKGSILAKKIYVFILVSSKEEKETLERNNPEVDGYLMKPLDFNCFAGLVAELGCYWNIIGSQKVNGEKGPEHHGQYINHLMKVL